MSKPPTQQLIKNAKQEPKVFYGLHFYPGVAEYKEDGKEPYRIMLNENTLRSMDATFAGKPVYVYHVDEVNLDKIQTEADGYVIESFYNEADGKHWCKFIVVSDKGHEAISKGWGLSNAYVPESFAQGGLWNGVEYAKEVMSGRFEHLAIVPDPRYDANVLTPAQFKSYNESRLLELKKVANSKRGLKMFEIFKKTKVENAELGETVVKLPKSGKEVTIEQLINAADAMEEDMDKSPKKEGESEAEEKKQGHKEESEKEHEAPMMANMDHHVMDGDNSRPLHEIMKEHKELRDCMGVMAKYAKHNDSEMDGGEKDAAKAEASADKTERNEADEDGGEKEASEQLKESDKTKQNDAASDISQGFKSMQLGGAPAPTPPPPPPAPSTKNHFDALRNAASEVPSGFDRRLDFDGVARGKARYGSSN